MNILYKKYIFVFQLIIYFIKSAEIIQVWDNEPEISYPFSDNEINLNSYAYERETGTELYLTDGNIIYNSKYIQIPENLKDLTSIQNPLFEYNSKIFFCSSLKELIWMNENSINIINNKNEIKDLNKDFTLKCLRGFNSIMVAYLGTPYILWYNHDIDDYKLKFSFSDSKILLAVNNYTEGESNEYLYTSLSRDDTNYYFNIFKQTTNDDIQILAEKEAIIPITNLTLYDNIEIVTHSSEDTITYLFSYDTNCGNFSFYLISLVKSKREIDGKYYFRFFNDFKIKYAKLICKIY